MNATPLRWRAVYFIQRLISRLAPPLHSLHWKILALLLIAIFLPALYFLWQVRWGIERSHLQSTEQGMIDTALIVAEALESDPALAPGLGAADTIRQRVFNDPSADLRIVIGNETGIVVFDSAGEFPAGLDRARESDVRKALQGKYGARWQRDPARDLVTLYSTIPYYRGPALTGTITIIKPTSEVKRSVVRSMKDLAIPALLAFLAALTASYLLSTYLTGVITDLARRADRIAAGESGVQLETWTQSELGDLARAVEKMRRKLEGKAYVEEMVTTFSHELKTPLAAMRGAAEIAAESPDPAVREKFLGNIRAEIDRLSQIVTNFLALSRIETGPLEKSSASLPQVAAGIAAIYAERAATLGLRFQTEIADAPTLLAVPADQLRRAIETLLDNAFQFTPRGKTVTLSTHANTLTVRDEGVGIEPGLQARIFDRFVTTVNPLTQRRGTGLGLAIAKSITLRHHGTIDLRSTLGEGSTFTLSFPIAFAEK